MNGTKFLGILSVLLFASIGPAHAETYTPDVAEFDGTNTMTFEPAPQLDLAGGGTIEFWVVPDWVEDPGYDPVIICSAGPEGASYLIAMLRDRDGIAIATGNEEEVAVFDFTDGRLHHVAISQFEDGTAVFVDGQVVGSSEFRFAPLPSVGVWIGSIDGENNQFRGAVAGMRVWDTVIEQETLVDYALKDIFDDQHPDLAFLSAVSDFDNDEILLAELELTESAE
jgi:hypothetical protein